VRVQQRKASWEVKVRARGAPPACSSPIIAHGHHPRLFSWIRSGAYDCYGGLETAALFASDFLELPIERLWLTMGFAGESGTSGRVVCSLQVQDQHCVKGDL